MRSALQGIEKYDAQSFYSHLRKCVEGGKFCTFDNKQCKKVQGPTASSDKKSQ